MISDTQDIDKTNHYNFFNVFFKKGNILVFSDDFVTSDSEKKFERKKNVWL